MGKSGFVVIFTNAERERIPVCGIKRVPDMTWEYISPSGVRHVWVGDEVPTLKRRTKQIPVIDYIFDGEDERPVETGETREVCVYFDPETGEEIEPATYTKHVDEFVPGIATVWCEFGFKADGGSVPDEVDVLDCEYIHEDDRAFATKLGGKWIVSNLQYTMDDEGSYYLCKGKAVLVARI